MYNKNDLLSIAKGLEDKFIQGKESDPAVANLFAKAIVSIEKIASKEGQEIGVSDNLEILYALASAFDASGDAGLEKEAEIIDDYLLSLAYPMSVLSALNQVYDKELEELRDTGRRKGIENLYNLNDQFSSDSFNKKNIAKSVDKALTPVRNKKFRPLEAPLSTRYSPDHAGVQAVRISDGVYQDPITGKVYNYSEGYTTDKGNVIPGTSVSNQTSSDLRNNLESTFSTREGVLGGRI